MALTNSLQVVYDDVVPIGFYWLPVRPMLLQCFFLHHLGKTMEGQHWLIELKMQITDLISLAERYPNNPEKVLPM